MEVVLGDKGRVTLPASIREALGLREGDRLEVATKKGAIILRPKNILTVNQLRGILGRHRVKIKEIEEALGAELD